MPQKRSCTQTNEFHFKIILLGECETGKTTIKKQICEDQYSATYKPTLGVEDGIYSGEVEQGRFRVIFYDTSGQERFRSLSNSHFSSSQAAIFVYDMKNAETLDKLEPIIKDACERKDAGSLQKFLLGNKNDLLDSNIDTKERAIEIAKQYKMKRFECAAKTKPSLMKVANEIVEDLIMIRIKSTDDGTEKSAKKLPKESKEPKNLSMKAKTISESLQSETVSTNDKEEVDPQAIDILTENRKSLKKVGCGCSIY